MPQHKRVRHSGIELRNILPVKYIHDNDKFLLGKDVGLDRSITISKLTEHVTKDFNVVVNNCVNKTSVLENKVNEILLKIAELNSKIDSSESSFYGNKLRDYILEVVREHSSSGLGVNKWPLRDLFNRISVGNPESATDATNKSWVEAYVTEALQRALNIYVRQPTLISPLDNATNVPLSCTVTTNPIQISTGIAASPAKSRYVVYTLDNALVYDSGDVLYSTTHTVTLPNLGTYYKILVKHQDLYVGWSEYSEPVTVLATTSGLLIPTIVSPANNSVDQIFNGLMLVSGPLTGVGIVVQPESSQYRYATDINMTGAISSGTITYTTSYSISNLTPNTVYYWQVRHKDLTGWTGWATGKFTTKESTGVNTGNFVCSLPGAVGTNLSLNMTFTGAIDPDGGNITYTINSVSTGLSFSKLTNIINNENIVVTIGDVADLTPLSFNVVISNNRGDSVTKTINILAIKISTWTYTPLTGETVQNFRPPTNGKYLVVAVGAGGYSKNRTGAGGGGCAVSELNLYSSITYNLLVGKSGPTFSGITNFHNYLNATSGQSGTNLLGGLGGEGINGNVANYRGGNGGGTPTPYDIENDDPDTMAEKPFLLGSLGFGGGGGGASPVGDGSDGEDGTNDLTNCVGGKGGAGAGNSGNADGATETTPALAGSPGNINDLLGMGGNGGGGGLHGGDIVTDDDTDLPIIHKGAAGGLYGGGSGGAETADNILGGDGYIFVKLLEIME